MLTKRDYPRLGETACVGELENGLRLTVAPKPGYRKSLAFLAVNYGGADRFYEKDGERLESPAGAAHFLEHKTFELEDGQDAMSLLAQRGANANAFTSPDMTAFHFDCADGLEDSLRLLLRFVSAPSFTPESVEREKPIITQEIRMSEDDPEDVMYYGLLRALYEYAPLRENVAGDIDSVEAMDAETLYRLHRDFYVPANMALVVTGRADPAEIEDICLESLPPSSRPRPVAVSPGQEKPGPVSVRTKRAMDVGAPMFLAGAKAKSGLLGRESVKFELTATLALSAVLGTSSPLYRRLYDEGLINETFGCAFENVAGVSHLSFGGETRDPRLVCLRVLEEAAALAARGLDEAFFERQKKTAYGGAIRSLGSLENIAYNLAAGTFAGYDYFETLGVLDTVTAEDCRGFLAAYLTAQSCAISEILTKER